MSREGLFIWMNETKEHQLLKYEIDMDRLSLETKNSSYHCQFRSSLLGCDSNVIFLSKKMALTFYCSDIC